MAKDAAVTVRLPHALRRTLEEHARRERRSLSAQIAAYLERGVATESTPREMPGRLLGLFEGGPMLVHRSRGLLRHVARRRQAKPEAAQYRQAGVGEASDRTASKPDTSGVFHTGDEEAPVLGDVEPQYHVETGERHLADGGAGGDVLNIDGAGAVSGRIEQAGVCGEQGELRVDITVRVASAASSPA